MLKIIIFPLCIEFIELLESLDFVKIINCVKMLKCNLCTCSNSLGCVNKTFCNIMTFHYVQCTLVYSNHVHKIKMFGAKKCIFFKNFCSQTKFHATNNCILKYLNISVKRLNIFAKKPLQNYIFCKKNSICSKNKLTNYKSNFFLFLKILNFQPFGFVYMANIKRTWK